MADVFVSYKREERVAVERIAQTLRGLGVSVWFDASMSAGETFSDEIDREAHAAKAILVCWSPTARDSQWVKSEALIGFEKSKLAACYVAGPDGFYPPTPFNSLHAEDLRAWLTSPSDAHSGWKSILRRIGKLCARADIESYGALDVQASATELHAWLRAHHESPLFVAVEALLRAREAEETERGRLEQEARERFAREAAARQAREAEERRAREERERAAAAIRPKPSADARFAAVDRGAAPGAVSTVVVLGLAWFAGLVALSGLNYLFLEVKLEFGLVDSQIRLLPYAQALAMLVFAFVAGIIADRRGVNRVHLAAGGLALTGAATLGMMVASDFVTLLVLRVAQGAGAGLVIAPALAVIGEISALRHRALALAVVGLGGWGAGLALDLADSLHMPFEWRLGSIVFSGLALGAALLVLLVARDPPHLRAEPARRGRVLSAPMLFLLLAVAAHASLTKGATGFLLADLQAEFALTRSELDGVTAGLAGVAGIAIGAVLADSASGSPRRYVSVFIASTVLAGASLALLVTNENRETVPFLWAATILFQAATYGAAYAAAQRMSGAGKYAIAAALVLAMGMCGAWLSPMAFEWLSDAQGWRGALLLWSALAIVAALALLVVRAGIARRVAEVEQN